MDKNQLNNILENIKKIFSNVSFKTYLYALGAIAVIVLLVMNVSTYKKYGYVEKDGKFYLDVEKIVKDYNLNVGSEAESQDSIDYREDPDANITEDLAKSLYLTNLYLEQNGMSDPTARGKILSNIIFNYQKRVTGKVYTKDRLNIIRLENLESLQNYYNEIRKTFDNYALALKQAQLAPMQKYSNLKTPTEADGEAMRNDLRSNLQKNINMLNDLINNLISVPATERSAPYHLELINLLSKQIAYYQSLRDIDIDPGKYILIDGDKFVDDFELDLLYAVKPLYEYFTEFGVKMKNN